MILQSLYECYERKIARNEIAPDGFVTRNIDFIIVLDEAGNYVGVEDLREVVNKRKVGKRYHVPSVGKQSQKHNNSGRDANILWDNSAFVMGYGKNGETKRESFVEVIRHYYPSPPQDVQAVLNFLTNEPEFLRVREELASNSNYGDDLETGMPLMTFRIGSGKPVIASSHVSEAIKESAGTDVHRGACLVTGEHDTPVALTHSVVKGVANGQSSGCNLVSFNAPSFRSYGLDQSLNAPTSQRAADGYTKALQSLIDSDDNRVRLADATVVFWAEKPDLPEVTALESALVIGVFGEPPKDDPNRGVLQVKGLLESINDSKNFIQPCGNFYLLGLSPNAARLSVRYWEAGPVQQFSGRIEKHFEDFKIAHSPEEPEYLNLPQILRSISLENKISNVPPNIAGSVVHSILSGLPYPRTLLSAAIRRNRAERRVNRARAAIIKACINRLPESASHEYEGMEGITVALDKTNVDIGYRLGRLFAELEKIQEDALGKLNAGIRDRFYGAASTSPASVFPRLLQLKNHHVSKLSSSSAGLAILREQQIGEIMEEIAGFPPHLKLEQQGTFAVGYYHQRQHLFTKQTKENQTEGELNNGNAE